MMHPKIDRSYITVLNIFMLLFTLFVGGSATFEVPASPCSSGTIIMSNSTSPMGVKSGDWIMFNYTYVNASNATSSPSNVSVSFPTWQKVEILSVNTAQVSVYVRMTTHLSDGTVVNQTGTLYLTAGTGTGPVFSGLVVPADLAVGDSTYITSYGNVTITSETTRTYVGANRRIIAANFSYQIPQVIPQVTQQLTFYWDKQTGVIVEADMTSDSTNATFRAVDTNMWQPQLFAIPVDQAVAYYLVAAAGILIVLVFAWRRRKKTTNEKPTEKPVESMPT